MSFNFLKNAWKIFFEKFIFQVRNLQLIKTEFFYRYSCIISIIQEYLQNVDCFYFLSKFLQQF